MPHTNDNTVQGNLLNRLRKTHKSVFVYLTNGVRLSGVTIESFDTHVVALKQNKQVQLLQKSAISSVALDLPTKAPRPARPVELSSRFELPRKELSRPVSITIKRRILKAETV